MQRVISSQKQTIPDGLEKIQTPARTLTSPYQDVLAYFDHPRTSNAPTQAINGHPENLYAIALGLPNLTHYTTRSPIHARHPKEHPTATTSTSRQAPPTTPTNTKSRQ